jgi:RHS repeat-associated protein
MSLNNFFGQQSAEHKMGSSSKAKRTTHLFGARLSLIIIFLAGSVASAFGQTTAARPDRGANTGGAYAVSDIESTNLQNGNVSLSIPLASLPPIAGGKLSWTVSARYNSKLWNVTRQEVVAQEFPYRTIVNDTPQQSDRAGWSVGGGYSIIFRDARDDFDYQVPPYDVNIHNEWHRLADYNWKKVILLTPDGAEHELRPSDAAAAYYDIDMPRDYLRMFYRETPDTRNAPMRYHSLDGTYLSVLINPSAGSDPIHWTIFMPDGTQVIQYKSGVQRIKDTNNNSVKIFGNVENGVPTTHYQDEQTLREIKVTTNYSTGNLQYQIWYRTVGVENWMHTDVNFGTTEVKGKVYSVESWNPNASGETGGQGMPCRSDQVLQDTLSVVRSIVYPQTEPGVAGRQFTFSYNSDTTQTATQANMRWMCGQPTESYTRTASYGLGSLSRIVMPTGAIVDYTYSKDGVHEFIGPFPSLPSQDDITREVLRTKKVTHDSAVEQWTYDIPTSGFATTSSATSPDGSVMTEIYYPTDPRFNMVMSAGGSAGMGGFVYRTIQPGQITERRWAMLSPGGQGIPGTGAAPDVLVSVNPVVAAEYTTLLDANNAPFKMNARTYRHDLNGNLTEVKEYDWFDPNQVTRDAAGVPNGVPASATLLRVANTSYHNSVDASPSNLYNARTLIQGTPLFLSAPKETSAGDGVTRFSYDNQAYGAVPTAGNITSVSSLDNRGDTNPANDQWITASKAYGAYGNLSAATDGRGKTTSFFYDDATHALPTRVVVDPENGTGTQTVTTAYDYATGLATGVTDQNGNTSTVDYTNQLLGTVDPFGRPGVQLSPPVTINGTPQRQRVKTVYQDSARKLTVTSDLNAESDGLLKSETLYDQLGRTTESHQYETSTTYVTIKQKYDSMGRVIEVSSPYRSGGMVLWTTTAYDLMGRVKTVTTPDGAAVKSNYNGNLVMITDQSGRSRRTETDALGRLKQVVEYNRTFSNPTSVQAPDANDYLTSYTYDASGNLRKVDQGGQYRFFMYDSLGRLVYAKNPEQGANAGMVATDPVTNNNQWSLAYAYDVNGNLTKKTDARGVVADYIYDALNRVKTISYSGETGTATPGVERFYDGATLGKGLLWKSQTLGASGTLVTVSGYDALSRPLSQGQQFASAGVWGTSFNVQRTYDLSGNVKTETYPSGRTVAYGYDGIGRVNSFTGALGDGAQRTYSSGVIYDEQGRMKEERFGTDTPVYNKHLYNSRGQLAEIRVSTYGMATQGQETNWNRGAIINHYSNGAGAWGATGGGADNNGNLLRQEVYIPNDDQISGYFNVVQHYGYDALNRLTSVEDKISNATTDFSQAYSYDRWGNRTISAVGTTNAPQPQFTVSGATNRLGVPSGQPGQMVYDAAGNLSLDTYQGGSGSGTTGGTRTYDAENRMTQAQFVSGQLQTATYAYDADGRRVKRGMGAGGEVWQVYGMERELLAEYAPSASPTSPQKEYGYRSGELLVTASPNGSQSVAPLNLALGKVATQSSTLAFSPPGDASHAVDGNTYGNYMAGSVTHTNGESQPWWQVDLGSVQSIGKLDIYNRTDCCAERLTNYYLFVSDIPFASTDVAATQAQAGVSSYHTPGQAPAQTALDVNRTGRYVRVQLAGSGVLSLTEVQVWGMQNLAMGKAVSQSSTLAFSPPGDASHAVDGNTDGNYMVGSVTHTNGESQPWWQVDLGSVRAVERVGVWNRTDCCAERLTDFYVFVSDAPFASTNLQATLNQAGVSSYHTTGQGGRPTNVVVGRTARYVRVQLVGSGILSLAEVQVWGADSMAGSAQAELSWLVTDQLGTPRMVIDKSGSLAGVRRHDYFPFGEEIGAGVAGRTTAQGYVGDNIRQKLTGHERDGETGLDYAQARYYGSTLGRFTGVDPYNPIVDTEKEEDFREYLGQPQNWNRYGYVWNNPLKYTDPFGEKVYVVTYTYGNTHGDDELRRAAETKAGHTRDMKGFDPKKDTVLLKGVKTKADFAAVLKEANGLEKQFGKVEQVTLYSHAGAADGPTFHDAIDNGPTQFTRGEVSNLKVNWSKSAIAKFYGCYTGANFAQNFANAQGVPAFGYDRYAYFSSSVDKRTGPNSTGRLYLIATDGYENGTWLKYMMGNSEAYPMVRRDPPRKDKPRR